MISFMVCQCLTRAKSFPANFALISTRVFLLTARGCWLEVNLWFGQKTVILSLWKLSIKSKNFFTKDALLSFGHKAVIFSLSKLSLDGKKLISDNFYLKVAITCKNVFPFAPVVCLVIFRSASSSATRAGEKKRAKSFKISITCSILQIVSGVH